MSQKAFGKNSDFQGGEESLFYKVTWAQQSQLVYTPFDLSALSKYTPFIPWQKYQKFADATALSASNFSGKTLDTLRSMVGGAAFADNNWVCNVDEDAQGRLTVSNVGIDATMMMGGSSMTMTHNIFSSIEFRDIVVTLSFLKADNSTYEMKLYLDPNSPNNNITPCSIVQRSVGTNGARDEDKKFQIGLNQQKLYTVKAGEKYVFIYVDFSIVFKYPSADFDPTGFINVSKIYPQIKFWSSFYNCLDYTTPNIVPPDNVYDITSILSAVPGTVSPESISIKTYSARIKMNVNNDNSAHVNLTSPVGGIQYDQNYLNGLRSTGKPIPPMFEKQFFSSFDKNIAGFYVDSNTSTIPDKRVSPPYEYVPMGIAQKLATAVNLLPALSPWWAQAFDYVDYFLKNEKEFVAVYGTQDTRYDKNQQYFISDLNYYPYPSLTAPAIGEQSIELDKVGRQGAYDNMHIQGYLGHYADRSTNNEKIVIHAPVCGFCCLHMHWRWGKRAYDIGGNSLVKGTGSEKFAGWGVGANNQIGSFYNPSAPLVPFNQHINIAITNPVTAPKTEDAEIVDATLNVNLDPAIKSVWYAANIDAAILDSYVVMEQGLGFAFSYGDNASQIKDSGSVSNLSDILISALNIAQASYPDFFNALSTDLPITVIDDSGSSTAYEFGSTLEIPEMFEILYRLMRYFNTGTYAGYDQIPSNINIDNDINVYPQISSMENL